MEINIYQGGNSPIILETPFDLNTIEIYLYPYLVSLSVSSVE